MSLIQRGTNNANSALRSTTKGTLPAVQAVRQTVNNALQLMREPTQAKPALLTYASPAFSCASGYTFGFTSGTCVQCGT